MVIAGMCEITIMVAMVVISIGVESFLEKNGWKLIFSMLLLFPRGLEDPVS